MIYAINPPVWRFPKSATGKIIIAIDRQKTWERVSDYRDRVIDLFLSQKMSEKHDQRFMCRIFLGGLRPQILDILLQNESYFMFKSVAFHAELLELILLQNDALIEESDDESDDVSIGGGGDEDGLVVGEQVGVVAAGGAGPAATAGANNGAAVRTRARAWPSVAQDGEVFFGEPNKKVDKLYSARYVLVLYR